MKWDPGTRKRKEVLGGGGKEMGRWSDWWSRGGGRFSPL